MYDPTVKARDRLEAVSAALADPMPKPDALQEAYLGYFRSLLADSSLILNFRREGRFQPVKYFGIERSMLGPCRNF